MSGVVEQIAISSDRAATPAAVPRVRAEAGRGLKGEYHWSEQPEAGQSITLIAVEALEGLRADTGIALSHEASRRNVLTRGIDLNALVGKRFRIGAVECEGVELCEPCTTLEGMTQPGVVKAFVHRAGLNADILTDGEISVGDPVTVV